MVFVSRAAPTSSTTDAELIAMTREGDDLAYAELYRRHEPAARRTAWCLTRSAAEAEDVVAEVFTQILSVLRRGRGPEEAFRPYLLTCVRHGCAARSRRRLPIAVDPTELPEHDPEARDDFEASIESSLVAQAFFALPERWQRVLWQTEVEGRSPTEVAHELEIEPGAVAALSYRARNALSQAYLEAHLSARPAAACRGTVRSLPRYTRERVGPTERTRIEQHLADCEACRAAAKELGELNRPLREALIPAIAGIPIASYVVFKHGRRIAKLGAAAGHLLPVSAVAGVAAIGATMVLLPSDAPAYPSTHHTAAPATGVVRSGRSASGSAAAGGARAAVVARPAVAVTPVARSTPIAPSGPPSGSSSAGGGGAGGAGGSGSAGSAGGGVGGVLGGLPPVAAGLHLSLVTLVDQVRSVADRLLGHLPLADQLRPLVEGLLHLLSPFPGLLPGIATHVAVAPATGSASVGVAATGPVPASAGVSVGGLPTGRSGSAVGAPSVGVSTPVGMVSVPRGTLPVTIPAVHVLAGRATLPPPPPAAPPTASPAPTTGAASPPRPAPPTTSVLAPVLSPVTTILPTVSSIVAGITSPTLPHP